MNRVKRLFASLMTVLVIVGLVAPMISRADNGYEFFLSKYTVTDMRDNSRTATVGEDCGSPQVLIFGGYGNLEIGYSTNTRNVVDIFSSLLDGEYADSNLKVFYFPVKYDDKCDMKSEFSTLSKKIYFADTKITVNNYTSPYLQLYAECLAALGDGTYRMPLVVYADSAGKIVDYTLDSVTISTIKNKLSSLKVGNTYGFSSTLSITGQRDYGKAYEVLEQLNAYRVENGLNPLKMDEELLEAAMNRAAEVVVNWDHTRPNGTICTTICNRMDGENLGEGQKTVQQVMDGWKNSPGHDANLKYKDWNSVGIGVFYYNGVYYWSQAFGVCDAKVPTVRNDVVTNTTIVPYDIFTVPVEFRYTSINVNTSDSAFPLELHYGTNDIVFYSTETTGFTFGSSNPSVASVDSKGNVTPVGSGTTTISLYKDGNVVASTTVSVGDSGESGVEGFIERLYTVALDRTSDSSGKSYWINEIMLNGKTGADVARAFLYSPEFLNKATSNEDFLKILYRTFFDRQYDDEGLKFWVGQMDAGMSKENVIAGFYNSVEWANICLTYRIPSGSVNSPTITVAPSEGAISFATRLYSSCLNREPDEKGLAYWAEELSNLRVSGSEVARKFFFSDEFFSEPITYGEFLRRLYLTFMNREPDADGMNYWLDRMIDDGMSPEDVVSGFANSQEWIGICSEYGILR